MKIVSAVNAMIANPDRISEVTLGMGGEIFFRYAGKYNWSMKKSDDEFKLWFYPGNRTIQDLASFRGLDWATFTEMVYYSSGEIGTREAVESFGELYRVVSEKQHGVDKVLDDIIGNADW